MPKLRLTAGTIGAHSFVKAKVHQLERTEIEFAPRRTHLIEKRGVRRGVVPAYVICKQPHTAFYRRSLATVRWAEKILFFINYKRVRR